MKKPNFIMSGTRGLNNVVDPRRLESYEDGSVELAEAVNVEVDNTFRPYRRNGFVKVASGSYHSGHANMNDVLIVKDNVLSMLDTSYVATSLRAVASLPMYYANVGPRTYYNNGQDRGFVLAGVDNAWEKGQERASSDRVFSGPPVGGTIIHYAAGVMYMAVGSVLYRSEPLNLHLWCLADAFFMFESNVVSVFSVRKTLYVSTEQFVYAHTGSVAALSQVKVFNSAIVPGTEIELFDMPQYGHGFLCTTRKGICFAGKDGLFINLTEKRIALPTTLRGAAYHTNTHYVSMTE